MKKLFKSDIRYYLGKDGYTYVGILPDWFEEVFNGKESSVGATINIQYNNKIIIGTIHKIAFMTTLTMLELYGTLDGNYERLIGLTIIDEIQ